MRRTDEREIEAAGSRSSFKGDDQTRLFTRKERKEQLCGGLWDREVARDDWMVR